HGRAGGEKTLAYEGPALFIHCSAPQVRDAVSIQKIFRGRLNPAGPRLLSIHPDSSCAHPLIHAAILVATLRLAGAASYGPRKRELVCWLRLSYSNTLLKYSFSSYTP
ncbi:MAG: hypothetical protein L0H29_04645, partial [Sinobacteraceae bacterium]|nr:hypothetical protein [Nevskiaceae bacterium]